MRLKGKEAHSLSIRERGVILAPHKPPRSLGAFRKAGQEKFVPFFCPAKSRADMKKGRSENLEAAFSKIKMQRA